VQDDENQDYSEQNEVDGMKKGAEHVLNICYWSVKSVNH